MNIGNQLVALVVTLMLSASLVAQTQPVHFEILPGSQYTYFPSGEGPGLPGCEPNDYRCDFGIAGLFSLEVSESGSSAAIVDAELTLTGNGLGVGPSLTTADGLEDWLEGQELQPAASILTMIAYLVADDSLQLPFEEPLYLTYEFFGTGGSLTGTGFDFRPVDGDAISFQVSLVQVPAVPEPSSVLLVAMAVIGVGCGRRRIVV